MKVYVTKWALEAGIIETEADFLEDGKTVYVAESPYDNDKFAREGMWFADKQDAIEKAYQMRSEAVQRLYLRIEKLNKLEFR